LAAQGRQERRATYRGAAMLGGVVGALLFICGGWNVFFPDHRTVSYVLLGIGGGAVLGAVLAWRAVLRSTA
jgi:hypothetical protein